MKAIASTVLLIALFISSFSFAANFPLGPDQRSTPGSVCTTPDQHRYPEGIAYCSRNVSSDTKRALIAYYDQTYGYHIGQMQRTNFKIDHYIPLCMGGSNETTNLWPQHVSVYTVTDPLEGLLCEKMSEGRLLQKDAIKIIMTAKNNLSLVPEIIRRAEAL